MAVKENLAFAMEEDLAETPLGEPEIAESRKHLIFLIDDLRLGVDAEYVVEILNNHSITYLPMMPSYIRGVFNMRGQIIPAMDVRSRLGKPDLEGNSLLVVLDYNNSQLGILVDAVDQIIDIPVNTIRPMPANNTQILVSNMCTIPDGSGTMLVLDCEELLSHE